MPRLCKLSDKVCPSIGADEWSRQSRIKAGTWTVTKKSEASLTNWHCFLKKSPSWSLCLTPGLNTSGLNRMSNSVSLRDPTAWAAFLTMSFVESSRSFFSPLVMESVSDSTIFLASSSSNLPLSVSALLESPKKLIFFPLNQTFEHPSIMPIFTYF